jgi:hypothetical protein
MSRRTALDIALDHPGYPRLVPHEYALATPEEWFDRCGLLLKQHVVESDKLGVVCADLGLTQEFGTYMVDLVTRQGATRVGKHFGRSISGDPIPPLQMRESAWLNANDIGRAIYRMAKRRVYVVRQILSVYAIGVNSDQQLVLSVTSTRHLQVARVFTAFVRGLKIADLQIGLVAYENSRGAHADLNALSIQLKLDQDTPKRVEKARNQHSDSPARQAGIEVVRMVGSDSVADQAFFSAMVLSATVEAWRFTLPPAYAPPAGASGQHVPNPAKTIAPESKMPPVSAIDGIEDTQPEVILHGS